MCAGMCPFPSGFQEPPALVGESCLRGSKRRTDRGELSCSVPEKRLRSSSCDNVVSPTPESLSSASPVSSDPPPRCRKRLKSSQVDALPELQLPDSLLRTAAEERQSVDPEEKRCKRPREQGEQLRAAGLNKVMESNDDVSEDQLCAFNSFQFWRAPLPELDLSLLDPQPRVDSGTKDSTEAMET